MPKAKLIQGTADETEAAFYDALQRGDLDTLMALWADDEEIVCIHPGAPRLVGHAAIRASWESIFERGGIDITPTRLQTVQNMLTAIHNVVEEVHSSRSDRSDAHVLATNVYIKTAAGWRIAVHHASVAQGSPGAESKPVTVLH